MLGAAVSDQIKFTVWGFGLGALIALFSLRSFWGAILVAATPFVAVMWVMGIVVFAFGSFSFLTIIVTTIILVIAFAESLFFIFNWLAYWREGMDPYKAVDETVKVIGPATALTMLTTLVSFASLSLTPDLTLTQGQGIQEFSLAGTMASLTNFVCLMTLPAAAAEACGPPRLQAAKAQLRHHCADPRSPGSSPAASGGRSRLSPSW